ncbi:DUF6588 family protein [Tenacibaculum maritimum]|uniref:DUF6588 family protein n=1 Tax=Tenacibaculum maritimum TaxID=107401 RepID=UPI001E4DD551|nr:DUF6588 family protein [Tenacibaculum maritimum]MCD9609831.1 hypothetical protein [Tenacibaculum maritimum]
MKKNIALLVLFISISISSYSQNGGLESILFAAEDASKLTGAYISPAMKGLVHSMNGGWYHTAKVHKKFGFDISIGANISYVPKADETFNIAALGLTKTTSTSLTAATIAGSQNLQSPMTINTNIDGQDVTTTFKLPGGIKEDLPINAIPSPAVQINLGLPYKFEAMLRLIPKIGNNETKGQLVGLGLKKEITDWFGPLNKLPLHVSLLGAYTNMSIDHRIMDDNSTDNIVISNGNAGFKINSYTIQAIASLNFPIINIYGGIGYGAGNANININGTYDLTYNINGGGTQVEVAKDPIRQKFNANSFRGTIGTRLSLGFFKIFADYTLQEYNTLNAGIAFSFR